jgi:hypothetical protein
MIPYHAWRIQHCFEHSPRTDRITRRSVGSGKAATHAGGPA